MKNETATSAVVHATDASFQHDVLESDKPVLVDFWAPWCGPCKAIAPVLEELANERPDVSVVKINVDDNHATAQQFNVRAIPTLLLFVGGEVKETKIGGAVQKSELEAMFNS